MNRKTRKHEQAKKAAKERRESELLRLFLVDSLPSEFNHEAGEFIAREVGRIIGESIANNLQQYLERQQEAFPVGKKKPAKKTGKT